MIRSMTTDKLAIDGGTPVRQTLLPYGRQSIDESDVAAVVAALRSDWLTTGPRVPEFEQAFAAFCGVAEAVAVCNGTAALHCAMAAIGIGPGDEVIVPAITFAATANCVVYQGGTPVFADVEPDTLLIDVQDAERRITPRTKAVIAVDFAGQPCDYDALVALCQRRGLRLVADACHALGGAYHGRPVGSLADLSTFSLHPVKPITSGEGGMITTDDPELATRMRRFRNHGISSDFRQREQQGSHYYEMIELGWNYRLTDLQCALGLSQLGRLPEMTARRQALASQYNNAFSDGALVEPLALRDGRRHAYHLYVVRLPLNRLQATRAEIFSALRAEGIGVNVHYIPVHMQPYYRAKCGTVAGLCPVAELLYPGILTLPMFPQMTDADAADVLTAVGKLSSLLPV